MLFMIRIAVTVLRQAFHHMFTTAVISRETRAAKPHNLKPSDSRLPISGSKHCMIRKREGCNRHRTYSCSAWVARNARSSDVVSVNGL